MLFWCHHYYSYNNHCQPVVSLETFGSSCSSNTNLIILRFTHILWFPHKMLTAVLSALWFFFYFYFFLFLNYVIWFLYWLHITYIKKQYHILYGQACRHLCIYKCTHKQWRDNCMIFLRNWKQKSVSREIQKLHEIQMINADYETSHESQIPSIPSDQCELEGRPLVSKFPAVTSPVSRIKHTEA